MGHYWSMPRTIFSDRLKPNTYTQILRTSRVVWCYLCFRSPRHPVSASGLYWPHESDGFDRSGYPVMHKSSRSCTPGSAGQALHCEACRTKLPCRFPHHYSSSGRTTSCAPRRVPLEDGLRLQPAASTPNWISSLTYETSTVYFSTLRYK